MLCWVLTCALQVTAQQVRQARQLCLQSLNSAGKDGGVAGEPARHTQHHSRNQSLHCSNTAQ